jgi:hypothetical protein
MPVNFDISILSFDHDPVHVFSSYILLTKKRRPAARPNDALNITLIAFYFAFLRAVSWD